MKAYVWFALAATHGDNHRAGLREAISKQLTPEPAGDAGRRGKDFGAKK